MFGDDETAPTAEQYRRTQATLIRSKLVLNAALRDPKVFLLSMLREQSNQLEFLESIIRVDFDLGPDTMRIGANGENTDELTVLVVAVRDAYLHEIVATQKDTLFTAREQIKKVARELDDKLTFKRAALNNALQLGARGQNTAEGISDEIQILQDARDKFTDEILRLDTEFCAPPRIVPLGNVVIRKAR
jgi:hypothetical protein